MTRWTSSRRARMLGIVLMLLGVALLALWLERRALVGGLLDRRLARAGVPARYRIVTLAPGVQVVEGVRLGDAADPDLTADRLTLRWRYRLGWPAITGIEIDGARLRARLADGRLSLGALDRLLPQGSGAGGLPDLPLRLHDARLRLQTAAGPIVIGLDGAGNPAGNFTGAARVAAGRLQAGGCTLGGMQGQLGIAVASSAPRIRGPLRLGRATCAGVAVAGGGAQVDLHATPALDDLRGTVRLAGFAGQYRDVRFGPGKAQIRLGSVAPLAAGVQVQLAGIAAPGAHAGRAGLIGQAARVNGETRFAGRLLLTDATIEGAPARLRTLRRQLAPTPLAPLADRLVPAISGLLDGSDVVLPIVLVAGRDFTATLRDGTLASRSGARARLDGRLVHSTADLWHAEAALSGTGLPAARIVADTYPAGGLAVRAAIAPYAAGGARLVLAPLLLQRSGPAWRFSTRARLDGPLGTARVDGLTVPLDGLYDPPRGLTLGRGCETIAFTSLQAGGLRLQPARLRLCGAPLVALDRAGTLRLDAAARDVTLAGRSGTAPVELHVASLHLAARALTAEGIEVRLGNAPDPTRLDIAALNGALDANGPGGRFAGAAGSIGQVPLALSGGEGTWRFADGALHLGGSLTVADRATAPRFLPLASRDVALDLRDGRIAAAATLRSPGSNAVIATVSLRHDLARGSGGAVLKVPGLTFARRGLQPEALTPLTLGVIANVAGTIAGEGRIDWTPAGTTSSGRFSTDRLDFAAAFGPVTGLSGTLVFTDLLGLVSAPHQEARIAEINAGVAVADGVAHYQLVGNDRVRVEDARWPFAGGTLALDPALLDFGQSAERRLTFRIAGLDAARFIQQLDFPNISATGTFDGRLPMVFGAQGGRIEDGYLRARGPGTLAYVGELSQAQLGTMGKLAFDALKAIRYSGLDIALAGSLDGEIVTRVRFDGVARATSGGIVGRMLRRLPFRFNIGIRAPFRGLVGSAESYANPALLLKSAPVQPAENPDMRQKVQP